MTVKQNSYSCLAIGVIVAFEVCMAVARPSLGMAALLCACMVAALLVVWLCGGLSHTGGRKTVALKLLASTFLNSSWLGVFYLLFFLMHLGWLTDSCFTLFFSHPSAEETNNNIISFFISLTGLMGLMAFYPTSTKQPVGSIVVVSGLSAFPKKCAQWEQFNLLPLVHMLHEVDESESCEFLILLSDIFKNPFSVPVFDDGTDLHIDCNEEKCRQMGIVPESHNHDLLRLVIKETAIHEFPNRAHWIIHKMDICFTEPCRYDDYAGCYAVLSQSVKERDKKGAQFYFNLSPGTVLVSSLMTLLAIDGGRKLFYYSQEKKNEKDMTSPGQRIQQVDKMKIPLQSLLSEALEHISEYQQ